MKRGEITWVNKIIITKDEVSKKPIVIVEGLWTGWDRLVINRALRRQMRTARNEITLKHKQADLIEQKRLAGLEKAMAAKKLKKLKEEEKKDVRGQRKSK